MIIQSSVAFRHDYLWSCNLNLFIYGKPIPRKLPSAITVFRLPPRNNTKHIANNGTTSLAIPHLPRAPPVPGTPRIPLPTTTVWIHGIQSIPIPSVAIHGVFQPNPPQPLTDWLNNPTVDWSLHLRLLDHAHPSNRLVLDYFSISSLFLPVF